MNSDRPSLEERLASLRSTADAAEIAKKMGRRASRFALSQADYLACSGTERIYPDIASPSEIADGSIASLELPHERTLPPYPRSDTYTGAALQD